MTGTVVSTNRLKSLLESLASANPGSRFSPSASFKKIFNSPFTQNSAGYNIGAGWSSPVAREAHNLEVAGSNPVPATRFSSIETGRPQGYKRSTFSDVGLFSFLRRGLKVLPPSSRLELSVSIKSATSLAATRCRFLPRFGQDSHLSLRLAQFGLTGVASAQSVRLYIVASGKRFAPITHEIQAGF